MARVDHEFVDSGRNWARERALDARGERGESRGAAELTKWLPEHAGDHGCGGGRRCMVRRRSREGRRGRGSPGAAGAHQEHVAVAGDGVGGTTATNRCTAGSVGRGEDVDRGGDCDPPQPIP